MSNSLLCISDANEKVPFPNISLFPGRDCGEAAKHCGRDCYAMKFTRFWPTVFNAWTQNSKAFRWADRSGDWSALRAEIIAYMKRPRHEPVRYFRIHVAGDFLSQAHVDFWSEIASSFSCTKWLAFTKQWQLFFDKTPTNLQIIYSMWPGMPDNAPKTARRAWIQDSTEKRIPADAIECPGYCGNCGMCWSLATIGRDVYFHKH